MPCWEPPLEHERREREFLVAALCHTTSCLSQEGLDAFPGLAEWRKRHDVIDASDDKFEAAYAYDGDPYAGPKFMAEFIAAFPEETK